VPFLRRAGRALRGLAGALGLAALIAGLSFLVAFPLWYFSVHSRLGFTVTVCTLLAAGLAALIVFSLRRAARQAGGFRILLARRILPGLRTTGVVLACLAVLYIIALVAVRIFR
jgi:hypothetical protein